MASPSLGYVLFGLRITQFVFALLVLALAGSAINNLDNTYWGNLSPDQLNFVLFCGLWGMLSVAYLEIFPRYVPKASHPIASWVVELLNAIFFFAGFIALAAWLGDYADGCTDTTCQTMQAATAFAAFSFALWTATSVILGIDLFKNGFHVSNNKESEVVMTEQPMAEQPVAEV